MIVEPKKYKVKDGVTKKQLMKNSFIYSWGNAVKNGTFKFKRSLYGNTIYLVLFIDEEDMHLGVNIQDYDGETFAPFYNPDDRYNNLVYLQVVNNYNNIMDRLVKKNILEYDEEIQMKDTEHIKIKYHADITPIEMKEGGDWIDLRAAEDVSFKAGEFKLISLGVSMQLPEGYEAHVVPRSSTYKNFGIIQTNHVGIIDNSYCGDNDIWKYPAYALRNTKIKKDDRICQFRIVKKQPAIVFETVEKLGNKDRGGIGSTGKN